MELLHLFWAICIAVIMLLITGIYCILMTYNLVRALIGLEILIKAVTLLLIAVGFVTGHSALIQSMVITVIVIEAVVVTVAVGIVLGIHLTTNSLDARSIRTLKG
jgi:NADH:ubiquinone oxidoreductase subunit K